MNATVLARDSTADPMSAGVSPLARPSNLGIEWDAENRLIAVNQGTLRSEFAYDGQRRRVRIVEKSGSTVTSDRRFLWCATQICEERSSSGGTVVKRYFDDGVQQLGQPLIYSRDHLGSIRELSDGVAAVKARYDYDPYGKRNVVSEDQVSDFGFTGHYEHSSSGTTLTTFRAYAASVGRWLSEDPAGLVDGPNLFKYVLNNPSSYRDPTGLFTIAPSCTGLLRQRIEEAAREIERRISNLQGTCLPCDEDPEAWRRKLDETTIHCSSDTYCGNARTPNNVVTGRDMTISTYATNRIQCPQTMGATVIHELTHLINGPGHNLETPGNPDEISALCFPESPSRFQ